MRVLLFSLVALIVSLLPVHGAPVLIFKGNGTQAGDSSQLSAGPVGVYLVVDLGTKEVGTLIYGTRNKQKILAATSPSVFREVSYFLSTGKSTMMYHRLDVIEIGQTYLSRTRALRGNTVALKASSQPNVVHLFPKILNCTEVLFADADPDRAADTRSLLRYQQTRTIAANDANQTIFNVFNALVTELNGKGYN